MAPQQKGASPLSRCTVNDPEFELRCDLSLVELDKPGNQEVLEEFNQDPGNSSFSYLPSGLIGWDTPRPSYNSADE